MTWSRQSRHLGFFFFFYCAHDHPVKRSLCSTLINKTLTYTCGWPRARSVPHLYHSAPLEFQVDGLCFQQWMWTAQSLQGKDKRGRAKKTKKKQLGPHFSVCQTVWKDEILPDALNWLLPRVVGLFFAPLTGGENIWKRRCMKSVISPTQYKSNYWNG